MSNTLESFAPVARRYRRWRDVRYIATFGVVLTGGGGHAIGGHLRVAMGAHIWPPGTLSLICWLAAGISTLATYVCFKCSECRASLHRAKGQHCPECGGFPLIEGEGLRRRRCDKCGLELHYGKGGREFKVHYCSECGSHLDEKGL